MGAQRDPTLIVIGVQLEFDDPACGERNNPGADAKIAEALSACRERETGRPNAADVPLSA
ncbi:MAG TPA: hypothetical protein VH247_04845 [Thermoleophilaceae bacterium]|jgi:hypothetical protein|nr:hypothetical protein [Thermoleophilaceae bacterium]